MIAITQAELTRLAGIERTAVVEARRIAAANGRAVIEVLEEQSGIAPAAFTAALAHALHFTPVSMDELHGFAPAFDVLPYTEVLRRGCALLHAPDGALVMAFADP